MKTTVSRASIFPLTVFGSAAVVIAYFDVVFTLGTRWLLLAGLALFLLSRARLFLAFRTHLAPAFIAWIGWVLLTTLWSEVPLLSFMKGAALVVTVVPLISGGIYWAQYAKPDDPLSYLAPLGALVLVASIFGLGSFRTINGGIVIFEGLSANANAFGTLIAISLPYPLHAAYRAGLHRANWPRMAAWTGVALALLLILLLTRSRTAAVLGLCIFLGFALVALPRRTLVIAALAGVALVGAAGAVPSLTERVISPVRQFLEKGHDEDVLFSRRELWRRSYDYAARGGIVGLGFGVSADSHMGFEGGSNTIGYAREKGNAQLATVEETGLTGLAISLGLVLQLFYFLISRTLATGKRETRVAAGLLTAALAGVILQSLFEAWWTAPGSLQSIFFWSTAGVAIGILRHPRTEPLHPEPQ